MIGSMMKMMKRTNQTMIMMVQMMITIMTAQERTMMVIVKLSAKSPSTAQTLHSLTARRPTASTNAPEEDDDGDCEVECQEPFDCPDSPFSDCKKTHCLDKCTGEDICYAKWWDDN